MSFKNNFSKTLLLSGRDIRFYSEEKEFYLKIPRLIDVYYNVEFSDFISILEKDITELNKVFTDSKVNSYFDFIIIILSLAKQNKDVKKIASTIINGLKVILPESYFDSVLYIKKDLILTEKLFEEILEITFISLDKKKIIIKEDDDEFTKMEKKAALRAERIRASARGSENVGSKDSLENIFAAVLYEFQQYKLDDVFELNLYTLNYLFKQIGKIANYEVSQIAIGNGLSKKHKYFIEK